MLKVGLTGGIACGKSTVAKMLVNKGALLIDADSLAREVVKPGMPAWKDIVEWLGESIVLKDRNLDRSKIARVVFDDEQARAKLNAIIHPRVIQLFIRKSSALEQKNPDKIQVWEIPLLFEAGMQNLVDFIVVVASTEDKQISRLKQRDGLTWEEAQKRIRSQLPLEEKIKGADYVIYNNDTEALLQAQVDFLWKHLCSLQEG